MTATSQNGWPVDPARSARTVPGSSVRLTVADGPAGDVLMYVAGEFDRRVEDLDMKSSRGEFDDWGYAARPIRGSTVTSNHASATAVDFNATRHPLGVRGTFTAAQVAEIHRILGEVNHVVRWGGDYAGRVDEMHFEINAPGPAVAAVAQALRNKPPTTGVTVFSPNDFLMATLNHHYPPTDAQKVGLPAGETVESHPLAEWFTVHCIRQGIIADEATKQTALLTEIRDLLQRTNV